MKKILSLVLAVVMIMAMAIPAFAASENEVAPCAVCTGAHTKGTYQGKDTYYQKYGEMCQFFVVKHYECSVCHKLFSETTITTENHNKIIKTATCNGTTQTWNQRCSKCGGYFTKYVTCPEAGHTPGNCSRLPI